MNLYEITTAANDYTDENFSNSKTIIYVNEAIAQINIGLKAKLPYFDIEDENEDYLALDEKWLRSFVVPYVAYSIKMNDGSLNEADRFNVRWQTAMRTLVKNKLDAISTTYRDTGFSNGYKISPHKGWISSTVDNTSYEDIYKGDE